MRAGLKVLFSLTALLLVVSCAPTYESKGDQAYKAAGRSDGDTRRRLQKEAYLYYKKALKAHPEKVSIRLRNRFVEMTLERANLVLNEGSMSMGAIPLFMADLDSTMTPECDPELRAKYALFLALLADSSFANQKVYKGLRYIDKALGVAIDRTPLEARKNSVVENLARENYEMGKLEYEGGQANKAEGRDEDTEALIRAEYHVKLAMYYDEKYPGAEELLSKLYKQNLNKYSAYEAVVEDKPDTNIYDEINKYDILVAVTDMSQGGGLTMKAEMYNYSYNPLRMRPTDFTVVDDKGNRFVALGSSKIDKEILDQEHETKMVLSFPKPKGKVKKLEYKNEEHYTEKNFF